MHIRAQGRLVAVLIAQQQPKLVASQCALPLNTATEGELLIHYHLTHFPAVLCTALAWSHGADSAHVVKAPRGVAGTDHAILCIGYSFVGV